MIDGMNLLGSISLSLLELDELMLTRRRSRPLPASQLLSEVLVDAAEVELTADEAEAVLAVLCGIGTSIGTCGPGEVDGATIGIDLEPAGSTRAMSPFDNLVGTNCNPT